MNRSTLAKAFAAFAAVAILIIGYFIARAHGRVSDGKLHIAAVLPLVGADAPLGLGLRDSIQLAVDETNAHGGVQGKKVELEVLEEGSDPAASHAVGEKLARDPRILGVIAHADIRASMETCVPFRQGGLPNLIAAISNHEKIDNCSEHQFRLLPDGMTSSLVIAKYAWNVLGVRNYLYVHDGTLWGRSAVDHFRTGLGTIQHIHVSGDDTTVPYDAQDFSTVLTRVHNEMPGYIVFGGRPDEAANLIVKLRAAGYTGYYQASTRYPMQQFIDAAGDKAEGALQVFPGLPLEDFAVGRNFLAAYASHGFHEPPGPFGIFGYIEAQALLGALDKSFLNRASLQGALSREELPTVLGPLRFNFSASTYDTIVIYKVIHGRWTPIEINDKNGDPQPYTPAQH